MRKIVKTDEFNKFTKKFWENNDEPYAFGLGEGIYDSKGELITVRWLTVNVEENLGTAAVLMSCTDMSANTIVEMFFEPFFDDGKNHSNINALEYLGEEYPIFRVYQTEEELTEKAPEDLVDVNFRHALMSRRYFKPNTLNINGHFGLLPNLIWTMKYAYTVDDYNMDWFHIIEEDGMPICHDRFPPMYWANPALEGVRVANTAMVRNGAYLGNGTTVMHYGFINANAGTLGGAMVEGTIPMGSNVDDGTDVGARAGMLGTLSGGGDIKITVGKNCLLGVDSEIGIPLGDNVLVKEGTVFSAGTPIMVISWKQSEDGLFETDNKGKPIVESEKVVKATELSGISDVTFRVNSQFGRIEVISVPNKVQLNELLHKND